MYERITLEDNIMTAMTKLAEGNPGAITVMCKMLEQGKKIDPYCDPIMTLLGLDSFALYGSRIWMLYKDVCGQDIVKTLAVLRAVQLGIIGRLTMNGAIDNGNTLDIESIIESVKKELPDFGKSDAVETKEI